MMSPALPARQAPAFNDEPLFYFPQDQEPPALSHLTSPAMKERSTEMDTPLRKTVETPLRHVRPNIVQSIRAFRTQDLQQAAETLGVHFLYANLAHAQSKADIMELLATQFHLPAHFGKNFDALYDVLTDPIHKAGQQPGFIVVLDQIPTAPKFDKEAREQLLDVFRDTAEFWGERKVSFRCFYSFL